MRLRLLILKLTATFSLWLCGCGMPFPIQPSPQPVTPADPQKVVVEVKVSDGKLTVNDATINVKNSASESPRSTVCDCGCNKEGCRCSGCSLVSNPSKATADTTARRGPQIADALKDSKPVVEMLSDFEPGQCGACDLAWNDWRANGASWPFTLVKRRGAGGKTSPTFLMPGREPWSPQTYSVGALLSRWQAR